VHREPRLLDFEGRVRKDQRDEQDPGFGQALAQPAFGGLHRRLVEIEDRARPVAISV
jgi:hypothetical protein